MTVDDFRSRCTRCGTCFDSCVQYDHVSFIDDLVAYIDDEGEMPDVSRCLTCGLCEEACPEGLSLKSLVKEARVKRVREAGPGPGASITDPSSERNLFRTITKYQKPAELPDGDGEIVYFPGCFSTYVNPYMAEAVIRLLRRLKVDFWVMGGVDRCCGVVAAGGGNTGPINECGRRNVVELRRRGVRKLITSCPGCYMAFNSIYPKMFGELGFEVQHITEFLNGISEERGGFDFGREIKMRVYYHDPCHLTRGMGVSDAPRRLIEKVPGTTLINPSPENSRCCGFGGGVRVSHPQDSIEIAAEEHGSLDCDAIITNCAGCMQNLIEGGVNGVPVFDLVEYLLTAMGDGVERFDEQMIENLNLAYREVVPYYRAPSPTSICRPS